MNVVIALDSFKGSLSAHDACTIVAEALKTECPEWVVKVVPMADGGEGTAAALASARQGRMISVPRVTGPLPEQQISAEYAWLPETRTAVIEMAQASGLPLVPQHARNPMRTTTRGTGELLVHAAAKGAREILLTLGGSATVDGGVGAASALGWNFLNRDGNPIGYGGSALLDLHRIVPPKTPIDMHVQALCDVDNPLCGQHGAARVYGPQKGATPHMVQTLEEALSRLAKIIARDLGKNVSEIPGSGAAGGFGAGAVAFLDAELVPGIDAVTSAAGLAEALEDADWVVTGEGRLDHQSLQGKVISGVARLAQTSHTKLALLAGIVALCEPEWRQTGAQCAFQTAPGNLPLQEAIREARRLLRARARDLATAMRHDSA